MKLANSSKEARKFLTNKKNHFERSMSSHLYIEGRKPSRYDYECGLENFFSLGEKRILDVTKEGDEKYILEFWNGKEFVSEEVWNKTQENSK